MSTSSSSDGACGDPHRERRRPRRAPRDARTSPARTRARSRPAARSAARWCPSRGGRARSRGRRRGSRRAAARARRGSSAGQSPGTSSTRSRAARDRGPHAARGGAATGRPRPDRRRRAPPRARAASAARCSAVTTIRSALPGDRPSAASTSPSIAAASSARSGCPSRVVEALLGLAERLDGQDCRRAHARQPYPAQRARDPRHVARTVSASASAKSSASCGDAAARRRRPASSRRSRAWAAQSLALVGDEPVEQPVVVRGDAVARERLARPGAGASPSAPSATRPPTSGETATTRCRAVAQRLAHPAQGEDRPDRDDRIRRPDDHGARAGERRSAPAPSARRPRRRGTRRPRPARPPARGSGTPAARSSSRGRRTCVRTGASLIGSTRAGTPSARRSASAAAVGVAPVGEPPRARQADREVAVAEVEPDVLAQRAQPVHDVERVVAQAPAALVDRGRRART